MVSVAGVKPAAADVPSRRAVVVAENESALPLGCAHPSNGNLVMWNESNGNDPYVRCSRGRQAEARTTRVDTTATSRPITNQGPDYTPEQQLLG